MREFKLRNLITGIALIGALCGITQKADAQKIRFVITVHVCNYAGVDSQTLADAEKVARGVFRKSGVEIRWVMTLGPSGEMLEQNVDPISSGLSNIQLSILSRVMSDRLRVAGKVMGVTPGDGADRRQIYVLYSNVEVLSQGAHNQLFTDPKYIGVTTSLILGHVIAHEMGHALLNNDKHTDTGIMRGIWEMDDLFQGVRGRLVFSPKQSEVIRTEVTRRMGHRDSLQTTEIEFRGIAR
jgi:hypothetical protein